MGYRIYTDGGFSIPRNAGGWACIVVLNGKELRGYRINGVAINETSNRMELTAFIQGLKYAQSIGSCKIYTDSQYTVRGYNEWMKNWKKKGWKNSSKKEIKNKDLWKIIDSLKKSNIKVEWVKGHNGDKFNELVDSLTRDYQ